MIFEPFRPLVVIDFVKSLLIIFLVFSITAFGQSDYGFLKVVASFDKYQGLNKRIRGTVKIKSDTYYIGQGELVIPQFIGKYEVKSNCWMNSLGMRKHVNDVRTVEINANDTTFVEIAIPDSLITFVNYLPILDRKGTFFPLVDSLAFLDEEGKRYGLWTSPRSYIGDCLNYFGTTYTLYDGDSILLEVEEICDMNFCYKTDHPYSITFTRKMGNKTWQLTVFPEENICKDIDDLIYFRDGQAIQSSGPTAADFIRFFRQNIRKRLNAPFVFQGKTLGGNYLLFESKILKDTIVVE